VQPLRGTVVADLTRYLPGPFASRELLRLGARVVKLEPPDGDPVAATSPGWYAAMNDGKEISMWDAAAEPPPRVLADADVVLEGFRPGVWERLGATVRDDAVVCSITGFGADGPRALHAGHDLNYLGYAGALADTAPAVPPVQVADLAAGALGAVVEILAALVERARTGRGRRIVVSMTHGSHELVRHRVDGDPVPRLLTGGVAYYRVYPTADGRHVTVAALEPKFYARLCELLDRPDLASRQFDADQEALADDLAAVFAGRQLADWLELFEGEDACVGPVLSLDEAAAELGTPAAGRPPALGEHTDAWRRELGV
jgi:alpha-methylacyl-CoA racemase